MNEPRRYYSHPCFPGLCDERPDNMTMVKELIEAKAYDELKAEFVNMEREHIKGIAGLVRQNQIRDVMINDHKAQCEKLAEAIKLGITFNSEAINGLFRGFVANGTSDIRVAQKHLESALGQYEAWKNGQA